ncbi:MAG: UMP kinase [Thermoplasmata archaeon]|nr:UMP kinase [Thermoplasmata archaeon]
MKIVVSLGGSLLYPLNEEYIQKVANFIKNCNEELYIVTGGGKIAREYISMARKSGVSERYLDRIGIAVTRINAMLLASYFKKRVPCSIEAASKMAPPVIMGGTTPGHSTDAVAAKLASVVKADLLVIATDVDGIYDRDPKKHSNVSMFEKIGIDELQKIAGRGWKKAGANVVIDAIACRVIKRARIKTIVLNGRNLKQLENAIYGRQFKGTEIIV